jgi:hypothetical protein
MIPRLSPVPRPQEAAPDLSPCDHRTVSKEGQILCAKIAEGENEVSPAICRVCPFKAVNCRHLRFSLRQEKPSPLIVRHNGRTEVWDDEPPRVVFQQAACSARVVPVDDARACAGCALREAANGVSQPLRRRRRRARPGGKVVPFPGRETVAATG